MKRYTYTIAILTAAILSISGCGKKSQPTAAPREEAGVKVDMPKLLNAFSTADPAVRQGAFDVDRDMSYGLYQKTLDDLQKLAANPALTDQQKQVVNEVTEQVKQVVNKAGASR